MSETCEFRFYEPCLTAFLCNRDGNPRVCNPVNCSNAEKETSMNIIGAVIEEHKGFANPAEVKLIVDKMPGRVSTDYYHVDDEGNNHFIRIYNYEMGITSCCVFPIPSCFSGVTDRFVGAGRDSEYNLTDGWYDSGRAANRAGIYNGDMVDMAICDHADGRGGVVYQVPVDLVRETMAKYTPEWEIKDPDASGSFYYSVKRIVPVNENGELPCGLSASEYSCIECIEHPCELLGTDLENHHSFIR